jgi:hypothetical protein
LDGKGGERRKERREEVKKRKKEGEGGRRREKEEEGEGVEYQARKAMRAIKLQRFTERHHARIAQRHWMVREERGEKK